MSMKITKKLALVIALLCAVSLSGCTNKLKSPLKEDTATPTTPTASNPQEEDTEPANEKLHLFADFATYVESLPLAPDFEKDETAALETYKSREMLELTAGKWYFTDNSDNYISVDEDSSLRVMNAVETSSKLVDVKLFKSENDKLVLIGIRAFDNCRVPVSLTIMEDGSILKVKESEKIKSIDTIGLDEKSEIILRSQYMTLVANGTDLKFYRLAEEISDSFLLPEKVSGAYSSMFLDKEGTLYLTLVSTNMENPWVRFVKVDEGVKNITSRNFESDSQVFPIYTKMVDGKEKEFSIIMDQDTYDAYVYTMYPNACKDSLEPDTSFEIVEPESYVKTTKPKDIPELKGSTDMA